MLVMLTCNGFVVVIFSEFKNAYFFKNLSFNF